MVAYDHGIDIKREQGVDVRNETAVLIILTFKRGGETEM